MRGLTKAQVQTCERSVAGTKVLPQYRTSPVNVATHHDSNTEMVASAILLGRNQVLRFLGWIRRHREFIFLDKDTSLGCFSNVEER